MKKYIFLTLSLLTAALIFVLTRMPGDESGEMSLAIVRLIYSISPFDENTTHFIIRKGAHFVVYAFLAFFLCGFFDTKGKGIFLLIIIPWLIASIYGVADEIHQYFVPGRVMAVMDMGINSAGAFFGAISYILIRKIIHKIHK